MKKNKIVEKMTLVLTGNSLTPQDIYDFIKNPRARVSVEEASYKRIKASRSFLEKEMLHKALYGVNTGFGPMASYIIGKNDLATLQKNLIRSHATGMGNPIEDRFVLAAMLVRLNTIVRGYSGVSLELIEHFVNIINKRIIPIVPEHGAVGTSGDLVQLAHIALTIIGEGEVFYQGKRMETSDAFLHAGLKPYVLKEKEGLALINGTSMMTAISALLICDAWRLIHIATRTGALALELVNGLSDSIDKQLHELRPHKGQQAIAAMLRTLLASSELIVERAELQKRIEVNGGVHVVPDDVQDVYSFRCIPQILGPIYDAAVKTEREVTIEMNSVTDNPIVAYDKKKFLHGGNFHGDYIATSVDHLKTTLVKLTMLAERRINFFLHSKINHRFPPFLNLKTPGLTLGLQGLQFVATSTTAQSQTLAFPQSVHSIPTNADNQDVVSMGTDAALLTAKVIENAFIVLAIEVVTLAQAVDCLGISKKLSKESHMLFDAIRMVFPKVVEDRVIMQQLPLVTNLLKDSTALNIT